MYGQCRCTVTRLVASRASIRNRVAGFIEQKQDSFFLVVGHVALVGGIILMHFCISRWAFSIAHSSFLEFIRIIHADAAVLICSMVYCVSAIFALVVTSVT